MPGNGEFLWFWGFGTEPTAWTGGYASANEAMKFAEGHCPQGNYTIVEADRVLIDAKVFDGPAILERLRAANAACWPHLRPIAAQAELADLEAKLGDCLDRWLRKHGYDNTTPLGTIRTRDYFPARKVTA